MSSPQSLRLLSTKSTHAAPRLSASSPIAPVPAYRSATRFPSTASLPIIENRAALTRSDVGLRPDLVWVLSRRPLCEPPVMRVVTLGSQNVSLDQPVSLTSERRHNCNVWTSTVRILHLAWCPMLSRVARMRKAIIILFLRIVLYFARSIMGCLRQMTRPVAGSSTSTLS